MLDENERNELESEIFAARAKRWLMTCPSGKECPFYKYLQHTMMLGKKIERLEGELKRAREFPDEF